MAQVDLLDEFAAALEDRVEHVRSDPIAHTRWLPLQWEFLCDTSKRKLIRCGNQTIGKTTPAIAEVVGRCIGVHPGGVKVPPPPIEAWIICATKTQSLGIQEKLAALLPWDEVDTEKTKWSEEDGFSPVNFPVVVFKNGSIIRIKTTGQHAISFAGASVDVVLFDEPPKSIRMLTEAIKRLETRGGYLLLSMTPINASTEIIEHIRVLCKRGSIKDHWRKLTPAELIPMGGTRPVRTDDGRFKDEAWIASLADDLDEYEVPIVVDGEWEGGRIDRYFSRFAAEGPNAHVQRDLPALPRGVEFIAALGVDHGSRAEKQIAALVFVDERNAEEPTFYIWREYVDKKGGAVPIDDARGILAALAAEKMEWSDLNYAHGDRVHMKGSHDQKSNLDLTAAILKVARPPGGNLLPPIETVKRGEGRGAGSRTVGERFLWRLVSKGRLRIHPRCERIIKAFQNYACVDDEHKDPIDAIRYALDPWIFGERNRRPRADLVKRRR